MDTQLGNLILTLSYLGEIEEDVKTQKLSDRLHTGLGWAGLAYKINIRPFNKVESSATFDAQLISDANMMSCRVTTSISNNQYWMD